MSHQVALRPPGRGRHLKRRPAGMAPETQPRLRWWDGFCGPITRWHRGSPSTPMRDVRCLKKVVIVTLATCALEPPSDRLCCMRSCWGAHTTHAGLDNETIRRTASTSCSALASRLKAMRGHSSTAEGKRACSTSRHGGIDETESTRTTLRSLERRYRRALQASAEFADRRVEASMSAVLECTAADAHQIGTMLGVLAAGGPVPNELAATAGLERLLQTLGGCSTKVRV